MWSLWHSAQSLWRNINELTGLSEKQIIEMVRVYGRVDIFEDSVGVYKRQAAIFQLLHMCILHSWTFCHIRVVGKDGSISKGKD